MIEQCKTGETTTPDNQRGLYDKYLVERRDGSSGAGGKHERCDHFVLDLAHDKHARAALAAYASACESEYPALAADLRRRWASEPSTAEQRLVSLRHRLNAILTIPSAEPLPQWARLAIVDACELSFVDASDAMSAEQKGNA